LDKKLLAVLSGIMAASSLLIPVSAPHQLTLLSTLHTSSIALQVFDVQVTTPTRAFVWNFTVNLSGKDVGSDRFTLVLDIRGSTTAFLFSDQNLTAWLSAPALISNGTNLSLSALDAGVFVDSNQGGAVMHSIGTLCCLAAASGRYHVAIVNPTAYGNVINGVTTSLHVEIHGYESWTTTVVG
jgi:hypothetical protein